MCIRDSIAEDRDIAEDEHEKHAGKNQKIQPLVADTIFFKALGKTLSPEEYEQRGEDVDVYKRQPPDTRRAAAPKWCK